MGDRHYDFGEPFRTRFAAHGACVGVGQTPGGCCGIASHERRAVATRGLSTQSANVFPRKPEVERHRTRDIEAALTDADESAQYQR